MEVIPLPTLGQTELPLVTVASTVVGATPPVEAPPTQVEVATTVTSQAQLDTAMVVPEEVVRSAPPAAQVTVPDAGRVESDAATVASEGAV